MAQSRLGDVWKTLRQSKDIKDQKLVNDFQEWAQEEEFTFDALVDDINDKEDESTISQWLKEQNFDKNNEFLTIRKLITPSSYNKNKNIESDYGDDNIQIDVKDDKNMDDDKNNDSDYGDDGPPPSWIPRQVTITVKQQQDTQPDIIGDEFGLNPDTFNPKLYLEKLDEALNFNDNPYLVQDIITQLQTYAKDSNVTINATKNDSESKPNGSNTSSMISGIEKATKVSGDDLPAVRRALIALNEYTKAELDEFVRFCEEEEYGEDQLVDDIEVFEEGDSAIIENIAAMFDWNSGKAAGFVNNLRKILGLESNHQRTSSYATLGGGFGGNSHLITPGGPTKSSYTTPGGGNNHHHPHSTPNGSNVTPSGYSNRSIQDFEQSDIDTLPKLHNFQIPVHVMRRKTGRSMDDIEDCFKYNNIAAQIMDAFKEFCIEEKCDEFNFSSVNHGPKLKIEYPQIGALLSGYMEKCQYELKVPTFKPSNFTKQDEKKYSNYMDKECPGIIKHDRDLLRYFLLTKETEKDLSSLLIDIVDRISVDDEHPLDLKTFTSKPFFRNLNKAQTTMIKNGLRTYHNRFFPRLTMNPLSLICDKISDYQKYSCILSSLVQRLISEEIVIPPGLIDFLIIPPGIYSKIINNFTAEKCINLGDIKKHLDDFQNDSYSILQGPKNGGLSADNNNFDSDIMKNIVDNLFNAVKKLILSVSNKQYQRIVIIIDRRWRLLNKKHCLYNKLRCVHTNEIFNHKILNKDTYDYNEYLNDKGLTHQSSGYNDDDDDDDDDGESALFGNKSTLIDFENNQTSFLNPDITNDTIYVFQPKTPSKRKLNEFDSNFCHETLMYLTKQCVLPRKKSTIESFKFGSLQNTPKYLKKKSILDDVDDEFAGLTHLSGDSADGYIFNLAVHIYKPYPNNIWYKYRLKWYLFTQSASIRVSQHDLNKFWYRYFVDAEKDIHKLSDKDIKKYFKFDLLEVDPSFKRWYYGIKRTLH